VRSCARDTADDGLVARTAKLSAETRNIFARHGFGWPQILKA
jgi:hypothetical protein